MKGEKQKKVKNESGKKDTFTQTSRHKETKNVKLKKKDKFENKGRETHKHIRKTYSWTYRWKIDRCIHNYRERWGWGERGGREESRAGNIRWGCSKGRMILRQSDLMGSTPSSVWPSGFRSIRHFIWVFCARVYEEDRHIALFSWALLLCLFICWNIYFIDQLHCFCLYFINF